MKLKLYLANATYFILTLTKFFFLIELVARWEHENFYLNYKGRNELRLDWSPGLINCRKNGILISDSSCTVSISLKQVCISERGFFSPPSGFFSPSSKSRISLSLNKTD